MTESNGNPRGTLQNSHRLQHTELGYILEGISHTNYVRFFDIHWFSKYPMRKWNWSILRYAHEWPILNANQIFVVPWNNEWRGGHNYYLNKLFLQSKFVMIAITLNSPVLHSETCELQWSWKNFNVIFYGTCELVKWFEVSWILDLFGAYHNHWHFQRHWQLRSVEVVPDLPFCHLCFAFSANWNYCNQGWNLMATPFLFMVKGLKTSWKGTAML